MPDALARIRGACLHIHGGEPDPGSRAALLLACLAHMPLPAAESQGRWAIVFGQDFCTPAASLVPGTERIATIERLAQALGAEPDKIVRSTLWEIARGSLGEEQRQSMQLKRAFQQVALWRLAPRSFAERQAIQVTRLAECRRAWQAAAQWSQWSQRRRSGPARP